MNCLPPKQFFLFYWYLKPRHLYYNIRWCKNTAHVCPLLCVSVRPAGVTVLVCVPQKLPSIYKLYFFFECVLLCCSKLRWDSHSVLLTTEDRPSWAADNIPLKVISPQNKARAPLFFLQITVLVTVPVYRVSVVFFSFFSFPFFLPHSCERFEFCFWPCPHPFPQAMAY